MDGSIKERVVLVSGANRGIGSAVAAQLQQDGMQLSLGSRGARTNSTAFPDALHFDYEASDREAASLWVSATVERFGRLDAVINCAGILRSYSLEDDDETALDELWEVNVKGPLRLVRAALPRLRESGSGRVVSIVSLSGKRVVGKSPGYAMSKFALNALTHSIRFAGWESGIRATALCPGWVNTDMAAGSPIDRREMTQPKDLARVVSLLLSLPNSASVSELSVNCVLESSF